MTTTTTWRGQGGHHQSAYRDNGHHPTMRVGRSYNDYIPYSPRHTNHAGIYSSTQASYGVWPSANPQISHEFGGYYNSTIAGLQPPNSRYNYSYQQPPVAQFYAANCFINPPARGVPIYTKFNRNYY